MTDLIGIADELGSQLPPRAAIARLLKLGVDHSSGTGACLFVTEPGGLRVSTVTGSLSWLQGRPVPFAGSAIAQLLAGSARSIVVDDLTTLLPPEPRADLPGWRPQRSPLVERGLRRAIVARATVQTQPYGAVGLFFADDDGDQNVGQAQKLAEFVAAGVGAVSLHPSEAPHVPASTGSGQLMPDGLAVIADDDRIVVWNTAAEELTGIVRTDAVGEKFPFPIPVPGQMVDHHTDDGNWLEIWCAVFQVGERLLTFRDVTRERQIRDGRELFLAVAGHELRTPITVIKGYAETLALHWDRLDDSWRRSTINTIVSKADQLTSLVDRMLVDNQAGFGGNKEPFDLPAMLHTAIEALGELSGRHRLVIDVPDRLPAAMGDAATIPTIVRELVTNSLKYSPAGGAIEISAGADATSVYFHVQDHGIGISAEHAEAVFSPFWQAEQGNERRFGGVGLGLYVIRRLLDRQGGWISLRANNESSTAPSEESGTLADVHFPRAALP